MSLYAVSVNILATALIWQLRYIMRLGVEMHVSYAALLNALPTASSSPTQRHTLQLYCNCKPREQDIRAMQQNAPHTQSIAIASSLP